MDYFYSLSDAHGYVHSIDNCVFTYYVQNIGIRAIDNLLEDIRALKIKYPECDYWEKLGVNACRKYHFFQNVVHLDDGITVFVGHYTDFDKDSKVMYVFPMMRLKINPNKHAHKPILSDFMAIVNKTCYDGEINAYDYAVDVPVGLNDVQVFGSNKEKGLYKGTRYYGQRDKNGYCRIYDKAKEQGIEGKLTRIEHTISLTKTTKKMSFEKIYVKSDNEDIGDISKTDEVIVKLCKLCDVNGLDYEDILNGLDRRKKKTIISYIAGCGYEKLNIDMDIHNKLLDFYKDYFGVKEVLQEEIQEDEDGFLQLADDAQIPFE